MPACSHWKGVCTCVNGCCSNLEYQEHAGFVLSCTSCRRAAASILRMSGGLKRSCPSGAQRLRQQQHQGHEFRSLLESGASALKSWRKQCWMATRILQCNLPACIGQATLRLQHPDDVRWLACNRECDLADARACTLVKARERNQQRVRLGGRQGMYLSEGS